MPKAFFIDTSRCTACRGCQIACKEWNELPANPTKQRGSHQNPPDLNPNNYKLVRFSEHLENTDHPLELFPGSMPPLPRTALRARGREAGRLRPSSAIRTPEP